MRSIFLPWPREGTIHFNAQPYEQYFNGTMRPVLEVRGVRPEVSDDDVEQFIAALAASPHGLHIASDDPARHCSIHWGELVEAAFRDEVEVPESAKTDHLNYLRHRAHRLEQRVQIVKSNARDDGADPWKASKDVQSMLDVVLAEIVALEAR